MPAAKPDTLEESSSSGSDHRAARRLPAHRQLALAAGAGAPLTPYPTPTAGYAGSGAVRGAGPRTAARVEVGPVRGRRGFAAGYDTTSGTATLTFYEDRDNLGGTPV